ncbi:MAG TPA: hypothetical protein VFF64_26235 [Candidatus Eremiobacteraceae bacterium]|nr:hypothetical protein [Candidatus Eremiobacteraceae bacterium]
MLRRCPRLTGSADVTTSSRRGYFGLAMCRVEALFVPGSSIFGDNAGVGAAIALRCSIGRGKGLVVA